MGDGTIFGYLMEARIISFAYSATGVYEAGSV